MLPSYRAKATGYFLISAFPYGFPEDAAQWLALALAAIVLLASPLLVRPLPRAVFVGVSAFAAASLSAAYVAVYLRGGPRIIDATTYFLEGRALSEGLFAWPLASPETATLGRFLVRSPGEATAAGIFPPGYPAALAVGFWVGSPLLVGPAIAAGIVVATDSLARRMTRAADGRTSAMVAQVAVLLSVFCAALRYHTADTMSHGLSALCVTASLALALGALDEGSRRRALAAGLFAGWLFATRPVSAVALGVVLVCAFYLDHTRSRKARVGLFATLLLGAVPGALLLAIHQHAATGAFFTSSQGAYYAVSDGPAGCFAYGFGSKIGCVGEHGDFVRAQLSFGYGPLEALMTTLRRLKQHLIDAGNAEPLLLFVIGGGAIALAGRRTRLLPIALGLQILAYLPFYFDGNYPGGGARFYADTLPFEHVLMALGAAWLASRGASFRKAGPILVAASLFGFAVRAGFDHAALRAREGGLPMAEASVTEGLPKGSLVFFNTDHGFNLAFDPAGKSPFLAAREHGDAIDRLAWEAAGRPPAFHYRFPIQEGCLSNPSIAPYAIEEVSLDSVSGDSLWPPREQEGAFALRDFSTDPCTLAGRYLAVFVDEEAAPAQVTVGLPSGWLEGASVGARVAAFDSTSGRVVLAADGVELHTWAIEAGPAQPARGLRCLDLAPFEAPLAAADLSLRLEIDRPTAAQNAPARGDRRPALALVSALRR